MKRKIIITTAIILVLSATGIIISGRKSGTAAYRTEPISKGDIQQTVTATGSVNAVTTVQVGTQVSGAIKLLFVDFNSRVKKGQPIAQIDPSTFEAQVQQSQANLLAAQANLDKSNTAYVDTKRTFERNKELLAKHLIAQSDLDTAETNYLSAKAQVGASKASVEQAKAALAYDETNLKLTKIVSPVDGIVISRNVDVGQTVAASFQTPTLFTIAEDLTKMQIDTNVAESDIGTIKVGQEVEFSVDAYSDTTFKGKVWQIRQAPITVQNVVTYDVVIQVNNRDLKLMPGMTANVNIITAKSQDVLRITNAALRFRFSERSSDAGTAMAADKKGPIVWVLENGKPKRYPIKPGITDGTYTEILTGNLQEGQAVIVEVLRKGKSPSTQAGPRMF